MTKEFEKFVIICVWLALYATVAVYWIDSSRVLILWTLFYAVLTRLVGRHLEHG